MRLVVIGDVLVASLNFLDEVQIGVQVNLQGLEEVLPCEYESGDGGEFVLKGLLSDVEWIEV